MLIKGNRKLGGRIHIFDLPAEKTCPDSSSVCRSVCYAKNGRYHLPAVKRRLARSLLAARKHSFSEVMTALIAGVDAKVVRVHSSGDLFSVGYARAWARVVKDTPDTTFYLYTRAWRRPKIRAVLNRVAELPNAFVWFSCDRETGIPRKVPAGVRLCFLQTAETDAILPGMSLVFRVSKLRRVVAPTIEDVTGKKVTICPTETGLPAAKSKTCSNCQLCFTPASTQNRISLPVLI